MHHPATALSAGTSGMVTRSPRMSSIAHKHGTAPPTRSAKNFNLRAYVAGGAATIALIAAGVFVFGSLAAYVAFNGLPVGGGDDEDRSVAVQAADGAIGAPASASGTLDAAAGAVAANPAAGTAVAPAPGVTSAAGAGSGSSATATAGGGTEASATPTGTTAPATSGSGPPATSSPTPASGTPSAAGGTGPTGSAVQQVEDIAGGAGVDLPLTDATDGITAPVDQTLEGLGLGGGNLETVTDGLGLGN
jgi:hypothetical protein